MSGRVGAMLGGVCNTSCTSSFADNPVPLVEQNGSWFFDAIVYVPSLSKFARVIAPFEKDYGAWLPVAEPEEHLKKMRSASSEMYRLNLELVHFSPRSSAGHACFGELSVSPRRVFNLFAKDTYMLKGMHVSPVDLPKPRVEGIHELDSHRLRVHLNLASFLRAEVDLSLIHI